MFSKVTSNRRPVHNCEHYATSIQNNMTTFPNSCSEQKKYRIILILFIQDYISTCALWVHFMIMIFDQGYKTLLIAPTSIVHLTSSVEESLLGWSLLLILRPCDMVFTTGMTISLPTAAGNLFSTLTCLLSLWIDVCNDTHSVYMVGGVSRYPDFCKEKYQYKPEFRLYGGRHKSNISLKAYAALSSLY